jgi:hypothetical protein
MLTLVLLEFLSRIKLLAQRQCDRWATISTIISGMRKRIKIHRRGKASLTQLKRERKNCTWWVWGKMHDCKKCISRSL